MELRLVKGSGPPRKSRPSTIRLREGLTIGRGADDQPVDVQLDCPGGRDAMVQQLAEKYVGELAEMAKQSKLVIVPDRPNDVSGVLTTAMGLSGQINQTIAGKHGKA